MRQPVQIDAEHSRVQALHKFFYVKIWLIQHAHCQVDDAGGITITLEEFSHRREPDRVHFEDRGRRHKVAHRSEHNGFFAEIIHAGCV